MFTRSFAILFSSCFFWVATPASANLLTDGDFQSAAPLDSAGSFTISANLDEWHVLSTNYTKAASGPSGSPMDMYAKHTTVGNGQDHRLIQFIDASSLSSGTTLELEFDYIYDPSPNSQSNPQARASLIGIVADRSYAMFGGAGLDGIFNASGEFAVAAPDALLNILTLPFTAAETWSTNNTLSTTLGASYAYIGVAFTSGCYGPNTIPPNDNCDNLRGVDNVSLNVVPAPATLALLSLGLAGIGYQRRKLVKAA